MPECPRAPGSLRGPRYVCLSDWKLPFPFPQPSPHLGQNDKHVEHTCACFIEQTYTILFAQHEFPAILLLLDKMILIPHYTDANTIRTANAAIVCEPTGGYDLLLLLIFTHNACLFPFLFKKLKPNAFTRSPLQAASLPRNVCALQKWSKLSLPNTAVRACRHHRPKQFTHRRSDLCKLPHSTCPVR